LVAANISSEEIKSLRVTDFQFAFISSSDREKCAEVVKFVERHEWLGNMPRRPTHRFVASYNGMLAGAVVMATPNSFSNLLGADNRHLEKLISRGACISWSPRNLASALVMFSIRWMVKHSEFRIFTAYSDTEARELGTIYQACNFIYLGQLSGARAEYFDPNRTDRGWFSDRLFRKHSQIRRYAQELGITWKPDWSSRDKTHWEEIPAEIASRIRGQANSHRTRCLSRKLPLKHKYAYILGRSKSETRRMTATFEKINPHLTNLPYPKYRGPQFNTAVNFGETKEKILTEKSLECRPQMTVRDVEYLSVKETASMLGVSHWTIYKLIEFDPTFPAHNIGVKKKFVVNRINLFAWMDSKTKRRALERKRLPSGEQLLKLTETQDARL
jgi:hypothetical protein